MFAFCNKYLPRRYTDILKIHGLDVVFLPEYNKLPSAVASHPDMLCFCTNSTLYTFNGYYSVNKTLFDSLNVHLHTVSEEPDIAYPQDILLNAFYINDTLYCKQDSISRDVLNIFKNIIDLKQGYAACSSCIAGNTLITADKCIYISASKQLGEHNTLLINPGDILLPPYDYGFIGGASCTLNESTVMFFGDISKHKDGNTILEFYENHNIKVIYDSYPLCDFGGVKII